MKKLSVTTILVLLPILILGSTVAYAHINWCPDDPILSVDGQTVSVLIKLAVEEGQDPADVVTGPVRVKVYVPRGADVEVVETGDGFGHGEEIKIIHKRGPRDEARVRVRVRVPTHGRFPVRVTVTGPKGSDIKEGWSKQWVKCRVELGD